MLTSWVDGNERLPNITGKDGQIRPVEPEDEKWVGNWWAGFVALACFSSKFFRPVFWELMIEGANFELS